VWRPGTEIEIFVPINSFSINTLSKTTYIVTGLHDSREFSSDLFG